MMTMRQFINNKELLDLLEIDYVNQGVTKVSISIDSNKMPKVIIEKLIKVESSKLARIDKFDWLALINSGMSHRQVLAFIQSQNH